MKTTNAAMTQMDFISGAKLYEQNRLRSKGINVPGEALPRFGFVFVYVDRDAQWGSLF